MTVMDILGQMGLGTATPIDRQHHHFSGHQHFSGPSGEGGYYGPPPEPAYSHPTHGPSVYHSETTHHVKHYSNDGHKKNAAMSALTLLAFLFFLNILQQCLKDHMASMTPPQIMIMTAGREEIAKDTPDDDKIDKIGTANSADATLIVTPGNLKTTDTDNIDVQREKVHPMRKNVEKLPETIRYDEAVESQMERIYTKNKLPITQPDYHDTNHESSEDGFPGFVSAMTDEESYTQSQL